VIVVVVPAAEQKVEPPLKDTLTDPSNRIASIFDCTLSPVARPGVSTLELS